MKVLKIGLIGIMIISIFCCTNDSNNVTNSDDPNPPEKLAPYEALYDLATFQERREALINSIPNNSVAIITTNDIFLRNGDVDYEFRPASNFFYLTGFDEPNAIAFIRKNPVIADATELIMFVEDTREGTALNWLGPVYGPEGVMEYFGADTAYVYDSFGSFINSNLSPDVYQNVYANFETNTTVADTFYNSVVGSPNVYDVNGIVDSLRVVKSSIEISSIQKAVDVSVQAFTEALKKIEPGMYEYEVESVFDYIIGINGCKTTSFPTIVASGPNINVLHYQANQRQMQDGDLVMIDFGADYGYYASDITRTVPVNGKFSAEQAEIYEIVLEAHQTVINTAAPGVSYYYLYWLARETVLDRLLEKQIITGEKSVIIDTYTYRQYIPAGLGHCVGLDVHDPFPLENNDKILKENMVLAIEPHIYLYENDATVDPAYWNISARIEDDILITSSGCERLSNNLPMDINGIEELMKLKPNLKENYSDIKQSVW